MSNKLKKYLLLFNIFILFFFTMKAALKEERYQKQESFYLKLAPVDPRSLLQGDYMVLNYDISDKARIESSNLNLKNGYIVVALNEHKIASFLSVSNSKINEENTKSIPFTYRGSNIDIGGNTFLFQEGMGEQYSRAKYAKVVITKSSIRVLDLLDSDFHPIKN